MSRVPISAVIIAYNDEPNMQACLESVTWADEIIVVDSFSTDATERISRRFTDKVYQHAFHGFGRLRNEAIAHATHDWIFSLDTDERATAELRAEIHRTAGPRDRRRMPILCPVRTIFSGDGSNIAAGTRTIGNPSSSAKIAFAIARNWSMRALTSRERSATSRARPCSIRSETSITIS